MLYAHSGVMSYYGPNLLTPVAQPNSLDDYTRQAIWKTLFTANLLGEVTPSAAYTEIEWQMKKPDEIQWSCNLGYQIIQGKGIAQGRLLGGCCGPLCQIMGTAVFPKKSLWANSIIFLDFYTPGNNVLAMLHTLRALYGAGIFQNAKGLLTNCLTDEEKTMLLRFLQYEAQRDDLPVLTNLDFGHRTPMAILPVGAMAEINCDKATFTILESGVQ